jgi:hypothetical protein
MVEARDVNFGAPFRDRADLGDATGEVDPIVREISESRRMQRRVVWQSPPHLDPEPHARLVGVGTQQVIDERRAEIDRGVRTEHIAERAFEHSHPRGGDVREPRQALGIAIETAIRCGRRHMLRRIDFGGERDAGVADDASAALRAPDMSRRKALAVLQRRDFVIDRLIRKRARQKHELHRGRRAIAGDGPRRGCERLAEQLTAVDATVFVDFAQTATKAPRPRRGEA